MTSPRDLNNSSIIQIHQFKLPESTTLTDLDNVFASISSQILLRKTIELIRVIDCNSFQLQYSLYLRETRLIIPYEKMEFGA